jgi:hypothetical protein
MQITQQLYNKVTANIKKITSNNQTLTDDLIGHCWLVFFELPSHQQEQMYADGKIENFITKCAKLNYSSKTSPFYYRYRKDQQQQTELVYAVDVVTNILEDIYKQERCDCVKKVTNTFDFYDQALFNQYYVEGQTYDQIHKYYGISKNHLVKHINKLINKIKTHCKNY